MTDTPNGQTSEPQDGLYQDECGGTHQKTFFRANFFLSNMVKILMKHKLDHVATPLKSLSSSTLLTWKCPNEITQLQSLL